MVRRGNGGWHAMPNSESGQKNRRWTLNGDFVTLKKTGVARYARQTVEHINRLICEGHPLARGLNIDLVSAEPFPLSHIRNTVVPEWRHPRIPQLWSQVQLPMHAPGGLVSLCNLAPVAKRKQIVCIHDLHTYIAPESYSKAFLLAHRAILPAIGKIAARITTVSEFSADAIVAHGVAKQSKTCVTYNGGDHAYDWHASQSTMVRPTQRPFVLCFGREHKYKNIRIIWQIADQLDTAGIDIVFVGQFDPGKARCGDGAIPSNVHLAGRISDDDLAFLLGEALCLAFPSLTEGFGLPAVEAMAHGCPVVASSAPCLPEVCGEAALFADPEIGHDWVRAITTLHKDRLVRDRLVVLGHRQLAKYSWQRVAETYLDLMSQVDDEQRGQARGVSAAGRRS